jgi:hypothetical protein
MGGRIVGLVLATVLMVASAACTPPPTPRPVPIGPNEHFAGLVNGTRDGAVVTTVCGGPTWPGRTGPVLAGQVVEVRRDAAGPGLTDRSGTLFARADGSSYVVAVTTYDTPTSLDGLQVPCDGTGLIVFDPCYGFVGCIDGGRADVVKVTFRNIAV